MKCKPFLCQSMFLLAAAAAHASPIIVTTAFSETIVYGTDTFETAGGSVLSTVQFVGWSDELPPDIANDIATDPSFATSGGIDPLSDPTGVAFIQSTVSQIALTTDLAFLAGQLPNVFLTSATPTAYVGSPSDVANPESFLQTLFPGYAVTYPVSVYTLGSNSYSTGAYDASTDTLYEGTVTFDAYEEDMISQPVSATPEPSTLFLFIPCALGLMLVAHRKKRGNP